jgi:hypothetical protein
VLGHCFDPGLRKDYCLRHNKAKSAIIRKRLRKVRTLLKLYWSAKRWACAWLKTPQHFLLEKSRVLSWINERGGLIELNQKAGNLFRI